MKNKIFIALLVMLITNQSPAQNTSLGNDSVKNETKKMIREIMEENSYTRVPSKDFENNLTSQIDSAVSEKFKFIYWLVGALTFIFGSTVLFFTRNYIKQSAEKTIGVSVAAEVEKMKKEFQSETFNLKSEVELKLKEVREKLENATQQLSEAKKEILFIRIEKIKNEVDNRKVTDETFKALMNSLRESENLIDRSLTEKIISLLSNASYELRKETDMEKIIQKNMNDENIKLTELVFINLASGYFYNYESTLDENDRNKCLLYINESLKKVANYGEAYALKLELLMIDYRYNTDPVKKENIKSEAKKVMMQILDSPEVTAFETIGRFERVKTSKAEEKCILLIEELFPEDIAAIKKMAEKIKT